MSVHGYATSNVWSDMEGAFWTKSFAAVRPHHSVVTLAKMTLAMPLQVARQLSTVAVDHDKVAMPV